MAVEISQGSGNVPRDPQSLPWDQPVHSQRHVNGHHKGTTQSDSTPNKECLPHSHGSVDINTGIIPASHLVDKLRLTIAITPCVTLAQMSDNTIVKDVVRLFTGDGITIPQISNMFK